MARSKRVPTGWIKPSRDVEPTLVQLKALEDALNSKLSAKVPRRKLSQKTCTQVWACCFLFAKTGPATVGTIPVNKIVAEIERWRAKTMNLRRQLWKKQTKGGTPESRITLEKIYLRPLLAKKDGWSALEFLAKILDAAIASSKLTVQEIRDPHFSGSREKELWNPKENTSLKTRARGRLILGQHIPIPGGRMPVQKRCRPPPEIAMI
jgi:hypothetical protein